jgi:hypothetical protein
MNVAHALRSASDPVLYVKDIPGMISEGSGKQYAGDPEYVQKITSVMKMWGMI